MLIILGSIPSIKPLWDRITKNKPLIELSIRTEYDTDLERTSSLQVRSTTNTSVCPHATESALCGEYEGVETAGRAGNSVPEDTQDAEIHRESHGSLSSNRDTGVSSGFKDNSQSYTDPTTAENA